MCGDWHRASDLAQEALIRVYLRWPRLERRGTDLVGYARRALVTIAIDQSRKRSNDERPLETVPEVAEADDGFTAQLTSRAELLSALEALGPRQRACVVLRYFEDMSVAEVAAALDCSTGTVKSQTARALDTLRTLLADTEVAS